MTATALSVSVTTIVINDHQGKKSHSLFLNLVSISGDLTERSGHRKLVNRMHHINLIISASLVTEEEKSDNHKSVCTFVSCSEVMISPGSEYKIFSIAWEY